MALLTFSIGPVHSFIGQARRIADLWAGSAILSEVTGAAMKVLQSTPGAKPIFPALDDDDQLPPGLPNRFVARVPEAAASDIARQMTAAVQVKWREIADRAVATLADLDINVPAHAEVFTTSWSWVREGSDYAASSREGARLFAASRVYRPFEQSSEAGTKCAICGERNALPNGKRQDVKAAWDRAMKLAAHGPLSKYFRVDQSRLCLVCAAKRLYPESAEKSAATKFDSFDEFQPSEDRPYFAVVTMDGDNLGKLLGKQRDGDVEAYQRQVSKVLSEFAKQLRTNDSAALNLQHLGVKSLGLHPPQLIYAGGEDVLFVADPRDALPMAAAIQRLYSTMFDDAKLSSKEFTISAAIVFAHTSVPAGVLFNDAERLLKEKAKIQSGRNSVAIALHKRSRTPVEVAFRWDEGWGDELAKICEALSNRELASRQTYDLAEADRILRDVFVMDKQWEEWLRYRLGQGEFSAAHADTLVPLLQPFFEQRKTEALRIARFIAVETGTAATSGVKVTA
jgi:CRISPR-associated protein Cmr2